MMQIGMDSSERYLDRIAFHEIDEIRYARIECLAGMRFLDPGILREAIHELIVQEENVVFNVVSKNGCLHKKVVQ